MKGKYQNRSSCVPKTFQNNLVFSHALSLLKFLYGGKMCEIILRGGLNILYKHLNISWMMSKMSERDGA